MAAAEGAGVEAATAGTEAASFAETGTAASVAEQRQQQQEQPVAAAGTGAEAASVSETGSAAKATEVGGVGTGVTGEIE